MDDNMDNVVAFKFECTKENEKGREIFVLTAPELDVLDEWQLGSIATIALRALGEKIGLEKALEDVQKSIFDVEKRRSN